MKSEELQMENERLRNCGGCSEKDAKLEGLEKSLREETEQKFRQTAEWQKRQRQIE